MAKNPIVRLDLVSASYNAALIKSVKYFVGDTASDIGNAQLVTLSGLMDGEREIYKCTAPVAGTDKVFLTAGVELIYDESQYHGLEDYVNVAGKPFRAISLQANDTFSTTVEAFDATPAVGNYVTVAAGSTKLAVKATVTDEQIIGKVISIENVGADIYYVVLVA